MLRLTQARQRLGWSKAKLAREAAIDQGTISKIESGRVRPYPKELGRLADALGVSEPSSLTEEVDVDGLDRAAAAAR